MMIEFLRSLWKRLTRKRYGYLDVDMPDVVGGYEVYLNGVNVTNDVYAADDWRGFVRRYKRDAYGNTLWPLQSYTSYGHVVIVRLGDD